MTVRVFWVPSPKHFDGRYGNPVIALVHHRMVGTLKSTDVTFTTGDRVASTNFGVGYDCGKAGHPIGLAGTHVHQYVAVDDAAWGNGNLDASGGWDDIYGASPNPNYRTISIEHHDNGGRALGDGKGVVPEEVVAQSIELDRLLLSGDWSAWKAAGIRANSDLAGRVVAEQVGRIVPATRTLVDHHFIAGKLKPYCWRPWADDKVGFPQSRYIAALAAVVPPDTSTEDDMTITRVKGEDWQPTKNASGASNGVLRATPDAAAAIVERVALGTTVRSVAEVHTTAATDNDWRLTRAADGSARFMLRRDWTPLVQGGDPAVDAGLADYVARKPDTTPYSGQDLTDSWNGGVDAASKAALAARK